MIMMSFWRRIGGLGRDKKKVLLLGWRLGILEMNVLYQEFVLGVKLDFGILLYICLKYMCRRKDIDLLLISYWSIERL